MTAFSPLALSRRPWPTRRRSSTLPPLRRRVWLIPVVVFFLVGGSAFYLDKLVGALAILGLATLAARRPDRALVVLVVFLPFQLVGLSWLFALGVPYELIRPLTGVKEAMLIGILVAALGAIHRAARAQPLSGRQNVLDRLDRLALVFSALVAVYAMFPQVLTPGVSLTTDQRLLAFRGLAAFVVLFFAARHAVFPPGTGEKVKKAVLWTGLAVGAIGAFEFAFPDTWDDFALNTLEVNRYRGLVLQTRPRRWDTILTYGTLGDLEILRIGSVLFSPLVVGFYLIPAFAIAVEDLIRRGTRSSTVIAAAATGAAILFTQTRSAVIAALVVLALAFRPTGGRTSEHRARFLLIFLALLVVALPAAATTGFAERAGGAATGDEDSAQLHIDAFWKGLDRIAEKPLGWGVGTSAGTGQRFDATRADSLISENYYLQVGIEVGVVAGAIFVGLTIAAVRRARAVATASDDPLLTAMRSAVFAIGIGALLLHAWIDASTAWTAWGVLGAALGMAERSGRGQSEDPGRRVDQLPLPIHPA